jgi:hypothetical protein
MSLHDETSRLHKFWLDFHGHEGGMETRLRALYPVQPTRDHSPEIPRSSTDLDHPKNTY